MIGPGASSLQRGSFARKNTTLMKSLRRLDTQHLSLVPLHYCRDPDKENETDPDTEEKPLSHFDSICIKSEYKHWESPTPFQHQIVIHV